MAERATIPAYDRLGRQLAAGEAPRFARAEAATNGPVSSAGEPLDKHPALPKRRCARCTRKFQPTRQRWMLCAACFKSGAASMEF